MKQKRIIIRSEYKKILDSAIVQYKAAEILAKECQWSNSTMHLILCIEELIKYQSIMMLMVNKVSFQKEAFPEKGKSIFNDHGLKHELVIEYLEAFSQACIENTIKSLYSNEFNYNNLVLNLQNRFAIWGLIFQACGPAWSIPEEKIKEFKSVMKRANNLKKSAAYADIDQNIIIFPSPFDEKNYLEYHSLVTILLKQTNYMREVDLTDEEFLDIRNQLF